MEELKKRLQLILDRAIQEIFDEIDKEKENWIEELEARQIKE